ncbi:hypothetical protein [Enterobacter asburiae]|uniref:hypothetical protein n=1 Tax=Enterobacter asburiae TaxID=61645 RepID=UPI00281289F1|nr:hypothetical protein [Enterobacter asburiae]WMQ98225.1 hypothetical protein RCR44_08000 [Enterobacter asburiae]WMR02999.1 hypothetical protein RCR45_08010 [Enterobacter asburiae]
MKQKFIEWFTKNNNGCSPAMEDDRSFVYEMTQHMFEAYQAGVAEGEARCAALAAENAGLKAGSGFFMYSEETGFEFHKTKTDAIKSAEDMIGVCREEVCSEGWPEDTESICWGVIMQKATEADFEKPSEENGWIGWSEFSLTPSIETPETDAFLAEVRAQGVDSAINTCISMMNHQHPVTSKAIEIMRVHAYQIRKGVQS